MSENLPGPETPLYVLREWADDYCKGGDLQRVLMEFLLERFIVLADERMAGRPEVELRNAIIEECADLADQNLDHYSGTECTYRGDVAEKIRALKQELPQSRSDKE